MKAEMTPGMRKICFILFLGAAGITALKILLVGYDIDEQYALAMSMRLLEGDHFLSQMWEPHQTSAFLAALLMMPYLLLGHTTTGIVLYLRAVGLLLHGGIVILFTKECRRQMQLSSVSTWLIGCILFFSLPKLMFTPEFSNMQIWFLLLLMWSLMRYTAQPAKSVPYLLAAGVSLTLEVLSYPSSLIVLPFCLFILARYRGSISLRRVWLIFLLPCVIVFLCFCWLVILPLLPGEFTRLLNIVASDGSHRTSLWNKLAINGASLWKILCYFLLYGGCGLAVCLITPSIRQQKRKGWIWWFLVFTLTGQLLIWLFGDSYPNYPSIEYFLVSGIGFLLWLRHSPGKISFLDIGVALPLVAFLGIVLLTNHPLMVSAPFLGISTAGTLFWLFRSQGSVKKVSGKMTSILCIWVVVLLFGKCYMVRTTGGQHYTIFHEISLIRKGPAAGIFADRPAVLRSQSMTDFVKEWITQGASVFYAGNSPEVYCIEKMRICTPSTISSPTFDDKMELYFEENPDKIPEYVLCDKAVLAGSPYLSQWVSMHCSPEPIGEDDYCILWHWKSAAETTVE
jgi:hypothetical protein